MRMWLERYPLFCLSGIRVAKTFRLLNKSILSAFVFAASGSERVCSIWSIIAVKSGLVVSAVVVSARSGLSAVALVDSKSDSGAVSKLMVVVSSSAVSVSGRLSSVASAELVSVSSSPSLSGLVSSATVASAISSSSVTNKKSDDSVSAGRFSSASADRTPSTLSKFSSSSEA